MARGDKREPFWLRPARARPRTAPPGAPAPAPDVDPPPNASPGAPQEPSFGVASTRAGDSRRSAIAALIADAAPPPAPSEAEHVAPLLGPREEPRATERSAAHGWIELSESEAARHPLHGVGGWLVLIALLLAFGLFRAVFETIDFWATTDHGGLAAWIMAVLRSGIALWGALILGLLLGGSRAFPLNFCAYCVVEIIYLGLFGLAFAHLTNNMVFYGVAGAAGANLVAMAYVLNSRRVNITYLRRLRARQWAREQARAAAVPAASQPA